MDRPEQCHCWRPKANHETSACSVSSLIPAAYGRFSLCSTFGHVATRNSAEISKANFRKAYRRFEYHLLRQMPRHQHSPRGFGARCPITAGLRVHTSGLRWASKSEKFRFLRPLFPNLGLRRFSTDFINSTQLSCFSQSYRRTKIESAFPPYADIAASQMCAMGQDRTLGHRWLVTTMALDGE